MPLAPTHPTPTPVPDRTTRTAVIWASAVALPMTVLVAVLLFSPLLRSPAAPTPTQTPAVASTAPVAMPAVPLSGRAATVCRAVTARLPATLRGLPRRPVTAGAEQNAGYGEPPLTVACGVAQPVMCATAGDPVGGCVPLDTELMVMQASSADRVCWYAEPTPDGHAFTTMDREIAVRVTVPSSYAQPAQWVNEFTGPVTAAVRTRSAGVPSGC